MIRVYKPEVVPTVPPEIEEETPEPEAKEPEPAEEKSVGESIWDKIEASEQQAKEPPAKPRSRRKR